MANTITSLIDAPVMLDAERTVQEAAQMMYERHQGCVVVTNSDKVIGVFTERDLANRIVGMGRDPATTQLKEVITRNLVTTSHDAKVNDAMELMREYRLRHLLAYDRDRFVGVVSIRNLAQHISAKSASTETMVNLLGGSTLLLAVVIIVVMIFMAPEVFNLVGRFFQ